MQTVQSKSGPVVQAVFSVCIPNELSGSVLEGVSAVSGAEFIGQFQEYITTEKRPQFPPMMAEVAGCVALIDCDLDPERALQTMERLQQAFPHKLNLIAVSAKTDPEFLVRAMRAGCGDFLNRPFDQELLKAALKRFQVGNSLATLGTNPTGRVISIFGVKGGVGTTTIAVHLAMHLVRKHHKKVLLIDHKHELGHVALHLGMKESVYHFDELVRNVDRLDADLLEGFVSRHSTGLELILSPDSCSAHRETGPEPIGRVMDYLRTRYDFIVLDSSLQTASQVAPIIAASDEVALVCTPDVVGLRDLVRRIEHLSLVTAFTTKLRVVINRSTSDDAVSVSDIEASVRYPITVAIPNNYADLTRAVNSGEPISPQKRGAFTQAISQWASRLVGHQLPSRAPEPEMKKRFLFGFAKQ
jgi:pilus assembly protein CpaE